MKKISIRNRFCEHRCGANARGIPFLLTFEQWIKIWTDSGHLHERGNRRGQYVMARFGDKGPYSVENVRIITVTQNHAEGSIGNSFAMGVKRSIEQRMHLSKINSGRQHSEKTLQKLREARARQKRTKESYKQQSESLKRWWAERKRK